MTPGDFPQLMADVKQFQAVLEQIFEMASNPQEKELLGAALKNIRQGVAEAESSVPHAFGEIETHAKKAQQEVADLQQEFAKKKTEIEALQAEDAKREAERMAALPPLSELYGPIATVSGFDLRMDMLRALGLGGTAISPEEAARALGHHREIWEDWHWE